MLNKKTILLIIIIVLVVGARVLWYAKNYVRVLVVENNGNVSQINGNQIEEIDQNKISEGEIIKEEDGWKRYRNEYYGIEFRFRDENNEIKVENSQQGIILSNLKNFDQYIYIDIYSYRGYKSLYEYLINGGGWNIFQEEAELVSVKEIINENNLKFFEIIVNVRQSSEGIFKHRGYYIEFENQKYAKHYNLTKIDKNYLDIRDGSGTKREVLGQIMNSFKFIK